VKTMRHRILWLAPFALALAAAGDVRADEPAPAPSTREPSATATDHARDLFVQAASLSKRMQWAEALEAFEEVKRLRPHPVVTFNIAVCERALGRYTRARRTFAELFKEIGPSAPPDVPASIVDDARTYAREVDGLVVHLHVKLAPRDARVAIDGRPLSVEAPGVLVAGVAAPGSGEAPTLDEFELIVDPGTHVIRASREGHADVVLNPSYPPGVHDALDLTLATLPAEIHVESTEPGAVVVLEGRDVGIAPVTLSRPAGVYRVEVQKRDFVRYATTVTIDAGEHASLTARLSHETHPITTRWWFWTGAAAVVAGGVVATYLLTRPTPQPPPYEGGSSGWVVSTP
jgi:hypothetical protein